MRRDWPAASHPDHVTPHAPLDQAAQSDQEKRLHDDGLAFTAAVAEIRRRGLQAEAAESLRKLLS